MVVVAEAREGVEIEGLEAGGAAGKGQRSDCVAVSRQFGSRERTSRSESPQIEMVGDLRRRAVDDGARCVAGDGGELAGEAHADLRGLSLSSCAAGDLGVVDRHHCRRHRLGRPRRGSGSRRRNWRKPPAPSVPAKGRGVPGGERVDDHFVGRARAGQERLRAKSSCRPRRWRRARSRPPARRRPSSGRWRAAGRRARPAASTEATTVGLAGPGARRSGARRPPSGARSSWRMPSTERSL